MRNKVNGFFTDKMLAAYGIGRIKNKFTVDRHIQCEYESITRSSDAAGYGTSYNIINGGERNLVTIDGCNRIIVHEPDRKEEGVKLTITVSIDRADGYSFSNADWKNEPYTIDKVICAIIDAYMEDAKDREVNGFSTNIPMYLEFTIDIDDFLDKAPAGIVYINLFSLSIRNRNYGVKDYVDISRHFLPTIHSLGVFDFEHDTFTISFIVEEHCSDIIPPLWVMDCGEPVRIEKRRLPTGLPDGLHIVSRKTYGLDKKRIHLTPEQIKSGEAKQYGVAFSAAELVSNVHNKAYHELEKENAALKESLEKLKINLENTENVISELKKAHALQTDDLKRDLRDKHQNEVNRLNSRISSMTHDAEMAKMQMAELEKKMSDVKRDAIEKNLAEAKKRDKEINDGLEREKALKYTIEQKNATIENLKREKAEAKKEIDDIKKKDKDDAPLRTISAILGLLASALGLFINGKKLLSK